MSQSGFRLSNYNYNDAEFVVRVSDLFARDRYFLGPIVQRSALTRTPVGGLEHAITKIDVLPQGSSVPEPEVLDYGTYVFVREVYDGAVLLTRLGNLATKTFTVGAHTITSTGLGFGDRYEPSRNAYSDWPCTVFDVSFNMPQVSFEPLFHADLRFFSSPFEAIRELLGFKEFHDSSDGRLGHILLCIPNQSGRFEKLSLVNHSLQVTLSGRLQPTAFKLSVNYKNQTESRSMETTLNDHSTEVELGFIPSELRLWLIAKQGFIADLHEENEYYNRGANAVLPKRTVANSSIVFEEAEPEQFVPSTLNEATTNRVFVIHGHNTTLKEGTARFLQQLNLEAIILDEQANAGATIIEKFELHSDVAFAVALLTGDDEGRKASPQGEMKKRARQNVIFEFGYFIGKLGRKRVCALVEEGVEIPSDYQGIVFIAYDARGRWKFDLVRELKEAGLNVDANKAL